MKEKDYTERFDDLGSEDLSNENELDRNDLKKIHNLLINDDGPDPPASMDSKFYQMLENESQKSTIGKSMPLISHIASTNAFRYSLRVAAGIALFIMGWLGASFAGNGSNSREQLSMLTSEVNSLKESLVLTMMKQNSPAERIQAVSMVSSLNEIDSRIANSLLGVLSLDPNDNVRLVALETLINYAEIPEVREGLIRSISQQKSPLIQIRLAEVMLSLEEKRSAEEFRKILSDVTLDYNVRTRLTEAVEVLL